MFFGVSRNILDIYQAFLEISWNILEREFHINLEYDTRKLYNLCISISIYLDYVAKTT